MKKKKLSNQAVSPVELDEGSFLNIDEMQLEKVCAGQPRLARKWNRSLAKSQDRLAHAENNLKLISAQLGKDMRENPTEYDLPKTTVDAINDAITCHDKYQTAVKEVMGAQYAVNLHRANTNALEHRKRMIEKMVDLFLADYYAEPRVPKETKEVVEEIDKKNTRQKGKQRRNEDDE